jgi:hypothetical protein
MLGQGGKIGTHWEGEQGGEQVVLFHAENDAAFFSSGIDLAPAARVRAG